jgi:hypothetical protein
MKTGGNQYLIKPGTVFSPAPPINWFHTKHTQCAQLKSDGMSTKMVLLQAFFLDRMIDFKKNWKELTYYEYPR